jgi:hypothetical protein
MNRNYKRTMNERTNGRSKFRQHNGRKKIIWMNERTNDRTNGRTNHERSDERSNDRTNKQSEFRQHNDRKKIIWTNERTNDRTNGRTIERSDERTNEPWTIGRTIGRTNEQLRTGGRTIEERPNDPCASVCLCGTWSGCVGGREVPWNGLGWDERRPLPLYL